MKGMDIDGINKKLSRIVGESIDVGTTYDKTVKPTLIESLKKEIPDVWSKVQAIERSAGKPLTEAVNEWPSTDDKPLGTMGENEDLQEVESKGEYYLIRGPLGPRIVSWEDKEGFKKALTKLPPKARVVITLINNTHGTEDDIYDGIVDEFKMNEAKLTYAQKKALPASDFVFKKERKYPIPDIAHGRNALARVSAYGTPAEKKAVRSAVYAKYPSLKEEEGKLVGKESGSNESSGWANFNEAFTEYMKNS